MSRDQRSPVRTRLQESLAAQPPDAEFRPARWKFFVLTHAEVVVAGRKDVQLDRDAGTLQVVSDDRAVCGVVASNAPSFLFGTGQQDRSGMCRYADCWPAFISA